MGWIDDATETIAGVPLPVPRDEGERHMLRALAIAEGGRGRVSPNPLVGAVLVSGGAVVGEGFHAELGGPHAEIEALAAAGGRARGATLYVTLEPCAHQGRTPPCADAILDAGVVGVVVALRDPNPGVEGGGWEKLEAAGVAVAQGPYGWLVERQNEGYLKWVAGGTPFVTLKMATSLDGKSATSGGESRWITGERSRADVHALRAGSDVVMVGIGTVLADDPQLTVRMAPVHRPPLRVVVDSRARTPVRAKVADTAEAGTLVAVTDAAPDNRVEALRAQGVEVLRCGGGDLVDLPALLAALGARGVTALLVEGGGELAGALWEQGLVDKLLLYVAPKVIAGRDAPGALGGEGAAEMSQARDVRIASLSASGEDVKIVAYPAGKEPPCSPA